MEHVTHALGPLATQHVGYLWLIPLFPLIGAVLIARKELKQDEEPALSPR